MYRWRTYLQHAPFTLATDHRILTHLQGQSISNPLQHKALLKLLGLNYNILGQDNTAADALSRRPSHFQLFHISKSQPVWMEEIIASYSQDDRAKELLQELAVKPPANS